MEFRCCATFERRVIRCTTAPDSQRKTFRLERAGFWSSALPQRWIQSAAEKDPNGNIAHEMAIDSALEEIPVSVSSNNSRHDGFFRSN